jgi:hypothetical protein
MYYLLFVCLINYSFYAVSSTEEAATRTKEKQEQYRQEQKSQQKLINTVISRMEKSKIVEPVKKYNQNASVYTTLFNPHIRKAIYDANMSKLRFDGYSVLYSSIFAMWYSLFPRKIIIPKEEGSLFTSTFTERIVTGVLAPGMGIKFISNCPEVPYNENKEYQWNGFVLEPKYEYCQGLDNQYKKLEESKKDMVACIYENETKQQDLLSKIFGERTDDCVAADINSYHQQRLDSYEKGSKQHKIVQEIAQKVQTSTAQEKNKLVFNKVIKEFKLKKIVDENNTQQKDILNKIFGDSSNAIIEQGKNKFVSDQLIDESESK